MEEERKKRGRKRGRSGRREWKEEDEGREVRKEGNNDVEGVKGKRKKTRAG